MTEQDNENEEVSNNDEEHGTNDATIWVIGILFFGFLFYMFYEGING